MSSLQRGLEILVALGRSEALEDGGLGVVRIAELVGREKSQVSRALKTLAAAGFVERDPDTRRYRLGRVIFTLGARAGDSRLLDLAPPVLELGLVYTSVDAQDPCTFGEVFATDGRIAALDLAVLEDDLAFFPSYLPALNIREDVEGIDDLSALFAPVSAALDNETIQALNARVDVDGDQPEDVAHEFLEELGLIG